MENKYKLINRIEFDSHETALRWKGIEKKKPTPEYKNCLCTICMNTVNPGKWFVEIWKEVN